jgi:hypothetical protein
MEIWYFSCLLAVCLPAATLVVCGAGRVAKKTLPLKQNLSRFFGKNAKLRHGCLFTYISINNN